jgi:hypothetical protein
MAHFTDFGIITPNGAQYLVGYLSDQSSEFATSVGTLSGVVLGVYPQIINSTFTTVNSNSGSWRATYTVVAANSANWRATYTAVSTNSGRWNTGGTAYTILASNSAIWNSNSYNQPQLNSTFTSVNSNSANWNTSYSTVSALSAGWQSSATVVLANSGTWNASLTSVAPNNLTTGGPVWDTSSNLVVTGNVYTGAVVTPTLSGKLYGDFYWKQLNISNNGYTAKAGDKLFADTTGGAFTINLPPSPIAGDTVIIADGGSYWLINNLTINAAATIEGISQSIICNKSSIKLIALYTGSTWRVLV